MKFILIILAAVAAFYLYKMLTVGKDSSENITAGLEFLEKNKALDGVQTLPSGLQYQVLQAGTGTEHPGPKSTVNVHYHGSMIDGTVFDSSVERGEPISFGLNQVIKGWTEGLQLMVVGEKARFVIPSDLAYGNRSAGKITPGSTLIFDVELLNIE